MIQNCIIYCPVFSVPYSTFVYQLLNLSSSYVIIGCVNKVFFLITTLHSQIYGNLPDMLRNTTAVIFKMVRGSKIPSLKSLALSFGIVPSCAR